MAEGGKPDIGSMRAEDAEVRFESLAALAQTFGQDLPVETWNPPYCGEIDLRIARDGTWFYQGSRIERPALVKLFSRILRKDGEGYVLVTPVERVGIQVEDVPFIACELDVIAGAAGQRLKFRTNAGDEMTADANHPLRFEAGAADGVVPYVLVRSNLWARLTRTLTLELMNCGETREIDGKLIFGITSEDMFFPIAEAGGFE